MTGSWRKRPWASLAIVAVFGLSLLAGDFIRGGPIARRFDSWRWSRHHQPAYEAWARHMEWVNENAPAELVARLKSGEDSLLLPGEMRPAGVDALRLMQTLRQQLGMIGRKDRGRWLEFKFDSELEQFVGPEGLALADLPEDARETIDLLGSWQEENPERVWGNLPEGAEPSLRSADFLDDKYQRALADVIPMDHPYWRAMVRLDLEVHEFDPLLYRPGTERLLRERLLDPGFVGAPLFRQFAPREAALRTLSFADIHYGFWWCQYGMVEWPGPASDSATFTPPAMSPDVLEALVLATETLGVGRGHQGDWASTVPGIFQDFPMRTRLLAGAAYGVVEACIQAELLAELHRWARAEKSAEDLKLTWTEEDRAALLEVIGIPSDD